MVRSQCSSSRSISAEVGPPNSPVVAAAASAELPMGLSPFLAKNSSAVVRSHIWTAPEEWPVMTKRLGLDPTLLEPSHSCTQKEVMVVPSTERMTQMRFPLLASRTNSVSVSGTIF